MDFSIEMMNCMGPYLFYYQMEKVNYVRKYIEVKFPTIGTELHNQIRSISPIILTLPHTKGSGVYN